MTEENFSDIKPTFEPKSISEYGVMLTKIVISLI